MTFIKMLKAASPAGDQVAVRVLTGGDEDHLALAGTLVLPVELYEQMLDVMIFGASTMQFSTGKLHIRFGLDEQHVA